MNKQEYREYLDSNHWKSLRRERLELSGYKCDKCGSRYTLQVHHIRYKNIYDVTTEDLETLCKYCHESKHGIPHESRPIKPDSDHLLKGVYHVPEKWKKKKYKYGMVPRTPTKFDIERAQIRYEFFKSRNKKTAARWKKKIAKMKNLERNF